MPVSRTAVVPVEEIFALRWAVLRTGLPRETAIYPEDALPGTFHVAAYDEAGAVQGCATFFPDALPGEAATAYRFRGMGSAPEVRGQGFGGAALTAGLRESAARGAAVVWCNGRIAATGFYHHLGFTAVGEEFTIEPSGPHYVFVTKDLDRP
ncbi:GNAT family N-acetyltransferase [Streptomyces cocklensis]|jgi:GNAT superfamily N-acetyltransferase|uniref:Predicted N-acyltransferase, GNAT family n=1 Tax=Actinacidiphila cocklensis TaxID=887465 RepID=A0A9W4DT31_9ACTN|nr:GNAT family N-acetyltransferase [Actinacidiphila cocklensis]MDD1058002.1 GNAT family N-acetyltransferase [Actinacidiphila cocklensis]WSX79551.1 GNAT family N-acetyltransferase [Streptomyces sp. NBC_00899]CAG6393021.1 Predicted N-acyltransferase, GNAT family [Actinacidiphila cocklensis]